MAGPSEEIVPSGATEVPGVAETQVSNDCPKEMDDDFNADEEPGPLAEANVNDNKGNLAELEDSGHESFDESDPDEPEEEAVDNELSLPSRERAVKVKFSGMEGPSPPPEVNLETISRSQLIAKLGGLQERLTQTQVDLKQEKSNRRKKEKNIFKMAKELSKRQVEASEKDETIQKLNQLLVDMGAKLEKASALEDELRLTIDGYEKKLAATGEELSTKAALRSCTSPAEKPKPPPTPPPEMPTEKPKPPPTPPPPLPPVKSKPRSPPPVSVEKPNFQTKEAVTNKALERIVVDRTTSRGGFPKTVMALFLCLAVFVMSMFFLSTDAVCAPVMPGTVLSGGDFVTAAPWWAPEDMKAPLFSLFCDSRPRVHLKLASGKLFLYEKQNGKVETLHKADATRVKINGDSIVVENKKGTRTYVNAPWAL